MSLLAAIGLALATAAETTRTIEHEIVGPLASVRVVHSFGACTVKATAAGEKPHARLELVAKGGTSDAERTYLEQVELSLEPARNESGESLLVRSLFPAKESKPAELSFAAELTLWLPARAAVDLDNSFGPVTIDTRDGDVSVKNRLADIELERIHGNARVDAQFGAVTARDVTGTLTITGKNTAVTAERIGGLADVRTSAGAVTITTAGAVHVEDRIKPVTIRAVAGDVRVVSSFGDVKVDGVGGDLAIDCKNGKIDARNVGGDAKVIGNLSEVVLADVTGAAEVHAPFSPVMVRGVGGKLVAENSARALEIERARGDIEATANGGLLTLRANLPTGAPRPAGSAPITWTLESEQGGVLLELTDATSAALELTTSGGTIECDFPGLVLGGSGSARTGSLRLREGTVMISATSSGGAIRVRRRS